MAKKKASQRRSGSSSTGKKTGRRRPPPPPPSNGVGTTGFALSLAGFPTLGLLSPLAVLVSIIGLFRAPRGRASAGVLLGAVGSLMLVFTVPFLLVLLLSFLSWWRDHAAAV
ncbi:MAG: hypothetical protein KDB18_05550 [Salinibacterium sp.]|nr:hypothetical protein [Salinibacterium sp.]